MSEQAAEPSGTTPKGPRKQPLEGEGIPGRPRETSSRSGRISRRSAAISAGLLAVVWLVVVFGSALADVSAANQRVQQVRADNAALEERVARGRAEIDLIRTDDFLRLQARAFGMGQPGERTFALEAGTPQMEAIVPLGSTPDLPAPRSPLDEWLQLLFG